MQANLEVRVTPGGQRFVWYLGQRFVWNGLGWVQMPAPVELRATPSPK